MDSGIHRQPVGNWPELMTEAEVIHFLRIPAVSKAKDLHNVIENLQRMHGLPRIHLCGQPLYPLDAVRTWVKEKLAKEAV